MSKSICIFIADDNKQYTELLKSRLQLNSSLEVIGIAHNGKDTVQMLFEKEADVLLLDIVMPDIDGLEIMRKIAGLKHKPIVIIVSALGTDDIIKQALSLGASYYFHKPVDCDVLISLIKSEISKTSEPEIPDDDILLRKNVTEILMNMKIPNNIQGFSYLRDIIILYVKQNCHNDLSKLYFEMAASKNTNPESIKQAVRYAIKLAFDNSTGSTNTLFKNNIKPNNLQFIKAVSSIINQ